MIDIAKRGWQWETKLLKHFHWKQEYEAQQRQLSTEYNRLQAQ